MADLDADEILRALADDVMAEGDLAEALRRLMERGWRTGDPTRGDMAGLRDLVDRLERRREQMLERYQLNDVLGDIRRELEEIVAEERPGVERRLDEASRTDDGETPEDLRSMLRDVSAKRLDQLDGLSPDVGERIRGLQDYDFLEPNARERFDELVKKLQGQVLDQFVEGMSEAIRSMSPEDLAANREMVRDLNELIRERIGGGDPDATEFLAKHGQFFPGARTFDDIIDQLAQRMAAMQSLMRSMSPQQRAELQSMMDALLRDDRLLVDLAQLASNLDLLLPGGLGDRVPFGGDEPLGPRRRTGADQPAPGDGPAGRRAVRRRIAGRPGRASIAPRCATCSATTPRASSMRSTTSLAASRKPATSRATGSGWSSPRGAAARSARRSSTTCSRGSSATRSAATGSIAAGGEGSATRRPSRTSSATRSISTCAGRCSTPWAARRTHRPREPRPATGGSISPPTDFEVHRTEQLTQTSTVLLVDMSRSMLLRGCFLAAKKVAVALDTLIRTQYPRDHLSVIGFAYYAREIRPGALAELTWHGYEYGTNLQHGLALARRILERNPAVNKEIVVITDGEPTAHFENGQVEFNYPPTRRTIQETLREVQRCTKEGITINTFMLERSRALADFVALMTRMNRGRAFYATPERLGEYVLVDFVSRRTKKVS